MEQKSSKVLRHKKAVSEYLKFQSIQKKFETLEKISHNSTKILPRPGEFVVFSSTADSLGSQKMNLSEFNKTGVLRPSSSSIIRSDTYQSSSNLRPSTAILTNQLRSITKPQIPEMLTMSSVAMVHEESREKLLRPSSGIVAAWKDSKTKNKADYRSNTLNKSNSHLPRPSTSYPKPSEKSRIVIKQDYNVKKQQGNGFSVTVPIDLFVQEAREEIGRTDKTKFLPLETYNPHDDLISPVDFIKSIEDKHGEALVYSKWFYPDGQYEWKICKILNYDTTVDRYFIQWKNGTKKHVSRINIRLLEETEEMFDNRLISAGKLRDQAEVIMKYIFSIESMTSPTTELPLKMIDSILNKIFYTKKINDKDFRVHLSFCKLPADLQHNPKRSLWPNETTHLVHEAPIYVRLGFASLQEFKANYYKNLKKFELKFLGVKSVVPVNSLTSLIKELEENFNFAQHKIEYEADLPYNQEKKDLFFDILPYEKFLPYTERLSAIPEKTIVYEGFHSKLSFIQENLPQSNPDYFNILYKQNTQLQEFQDLIFFLKYFPDVNNLSKFIRLQKLESIETLRDFRNICFDTQYSIQDILNTANEQRQKRNEERNNARIYVNQVIVLESKLPASLLQKMLKFMKLCNSILEKQLKICLNNSLDFLFNQIESINNTLREKGDLIDVLNYFHLNKRLKHEMCFKSRLVVGEKAILFEPTYQEILAGFQDFLWETVRSLHRVPSLELAEVGNARESGFMHVLDEDDETIKISIEKCCEALDTMWEYPETLINELSGTEYLITADPEHIKQAITKKFDIEFIAEQLENLQIAKETIQDLFCNRSLLRLGIFIIKIKKANQILIDKYNALEKFFQDILSEKSTNEIQLLEEQEDEIMKIIKHEPKNLEELYDIKTFLSVDLKERLQYIENHLKLCFDCITTLEDFGIKVDEEITIRAWVSYGLPQRIDKERLLCNSTIRKSEKEFAEQLKLGLAQILIDIETIRERFEAVKEESDINKYEDISQSYEILKDTIEKTSEMCRTLNIRENIVGVLCTDFKHLEAIKREFSNYCKLWFYIRDFSYHEPMWLRGSLADIDSESVSSEVELYITELKRMQNSVFKDNPKALQLTLALQAKVNKFAPNVSILKNLKSTGMKDRHWEKISNLTGIHINKNLNVSLQSLIADKILDYDEEIEEIADCAYKEQNIEVSKLKMEKEWETILFKLAPYKKTQNFILVDTHEIWNKLDDQLMKVISICNSPYAEFMEKEINQWKNALSKLQEILEEWEKLQKTWSYIYPIFLSPDISKELPAVASKFAYVNSQWESMINLVKNNPVVVEVCWSAPKLLDQIKYARDSLEGILKSLYDYLNTKRKAFPRFYFLSNEELLTILSNSSEWDSIQKYINKCFEGINKIIIEDDRIIGMESPEQETVFFVQGLDIKHEGQIKNIEVWMLEVQKAMENTLKTAMVDCTNSDPNFTDINWIQKYPSQLVQTMLQTSWTISAEKSLETASLPLLLKTINDDLLKMVIKVRENIGANLLSTISTLIILTTHNKDCISNLIEKRIKSSNDFSWQAVLRYYFNGKITVKMIDTVREYGYEYIGNQGRLVITPLTDRCHRILMIAMRLCMGGAPEGPAGTGKTETIKDLAKALAKKCVVFNCSDSLDHHAMAKFFTGLTSCGAWACFDEFNRMEQEVLSVVAEQITTIQSAMMKNSKKFLFEDEYIALDSSCAIFITMNPGYLGRSELPDNLKALFRSVAMMVPDYAMIAEIYLYSYGFEQARTLSKKLFTSFKLASEQLSTQKHYDYGMRAVSAVIKKAGMIKRNDPGNEDEILLKALQEITLPKFLPEDLPLISDILSDLFPNLRKNNDYDEIVMYVDQALYELNLVDSVGISKKILELYQLIQVRHGNMILGSAMTGKSTVLNILAKAISLYEGSKVNGEYRIDRVWINPKSVTLKQLYGEPEESSHDWKDGILSLYIREFSVLGDNLHWVELDGPVDALWIENLNTVLDDNKKLCLSSGEIIKLTNSMKMIFEVENLEQASPATVSRCGMVYLHPDTLNPKIVVDSWLKNLPAGYKSSEYVELIKAIFDYFFDPCLDFLKTSQCVIDVNPSWAVNNVISLMEALMLKSSRNKTDHDQMFNEIKYKVVTEKKATIRKNSTINKTGIRRQTRKITKKQTIISEFNIDDSNIGRLEKAEIICFFLFSLSWGLGGFLEENEKKKFNEVIHKLYKSSLGKGTGATPLEISKKLGPVFQNDTYFTHFYNTETRNWESWNSLLLRVPKERPADLNFILVPCTETVSRTYLLSKLVPKGYNVLMTGLTGTCKSSLAKKLIEDLDSQKFTSIINTLSAQSSCTMVQQIIESKLTKRKKGVYGCEIGKKFVVVIDDLNMPSKEEYGAQPAIEILRSAVDKSKWYDLETLDLKVLEDITCLGVMAHPGGGRQSLSRRFMRHFFLMNTSEYCKDSLENIFKSYLTFALEDYSQKIKDTIAQITSATIELYQIVVNKLPPTPTKSHYTFNLRDITRVFQGIVMVSASKLDNTTKMYQLWAHECFRVFSDRLIEKDTNAFNNVLARCLDKWIHIKINELIPQKELIYCNFFPDRSYQECPSISSAREFLENGLDEYNSKSLSKVEIVFFDFAIIHLARISRVISAANGHLLLIGTGGNGRKSLCKIAAYLNDYNIFEIQISNTYGLNEWKEDLKSLLFKTGVQNSKELFILKDYELNKDVYFENVNNILNSGEVPNLFTQDEKENIIDKIREQRGMSIKSFSERWEAFSQNTRKNLHIVLCISPIGKNLRKILRQFPSFTNCCSVNWMAEWPEEALRGVVERSIKESGITQDPIKQKDIQDISVSFHYSALECSQAYTNETKRVHNITSSDYLQFLLYMRKLMGTKKGELIKTRKKYKLGVKKIESTQVNVDKIRQELISLKPVLEEKTKVTEEIMKVIHDKNVQADKERNLVSSEQKESAVQAEIAAAIKQECEEKLNKAIPELEAAIKALKTLKKDEINEVRNMQKPPYPVKLAVEAVVIIHKEKPVKFSDPQDKTKIIFDYFEAGKKMMKDSHFIQKLQRFDKESLDQETIDKLQPYMENPKFEPAMVRKASIAAEGLCKWVRAMVNYYFINKDVKPKQESLKLAKQTMDTKLILLQTKEAELKVIEEMILELKGEYETKNQDKQKLTAEIRKCEIQMGRAVKLIEKLKGEKERWSGIVVKMKEDMKNLLGDVILAAGMIAYMGNIIGGYREKIIQNNWIPAISATGSITCSQNFLLKNLLSDELQLQNWHINSLPNDKGSVENAIILSQSIKWPLFIDPQSQAIKWISKMKLQEKSQLFVIKTSFEEFYSVIENCMFLGNSLWIDNIGETLDPTLLPLLNKSFTQQVGISMVKLGDNLKQIDPGFRLYMSTSIPNPNFPPETCTKVNIINFTITQEGITEQLLGIVCKKELPKETEERNKLVLQSFNFIKKMQDFEDIILKMLQGSGENILDDEVLINSLTESKTLSEETEKKLQSAMIAEHKISELQTNYIPVASLSACLYFCVSDMQNIDPMYIFSMEWFLIIFNRGINKAAQNKNLQQRIENLVLAFREELYSNISMCLFEKDKLLFSFLISIRLLKEFNAQQWRYFLTGMGVHIEKPPNPAKEIIQDKIWSSICELSFLPEFFSLINDIISNKNDWIKFITSNTEFKEVPTFNKFCENIPQPYNKSSMLEKLLLIKAIKPETLTEAVKAFVKSNIGDHYLSPPLVSIKQAYSESEPLLPIIFVLTSGNNPQPMIKSFAVEQGTNLYSISLGKGQGDKASKILKEYAVSGGWLLLQNCHLMPSWMPELENIIQRLKSDSEKGLVRVNSSFRLFLTTKSNTKFPITILQHAVKIINEPPQGLKGNLKKLFKDMNSTNEGKEFFSNCTKLEEWQRLLFGLCFFHCQILERQKFGALGWNVKYEFSTGDLIVSQRQLKMFIEKYSEPPYEALVNLTGECNYGGKVTDSFDKVILNSLLSDIYKDDIMYPHYTLCSLDTYKIPNCPTTLEDFFNTIDKFPTQDSPLIFGLHPNAYISFSKEQGQYLLESLVKIEIKSTATVINEKQELLKIFDEIFGFIDVSLSIPDTIKKYPIQYKESLNTFLQQEVHKFNKLTTIIKQSIENIKKALNGHIIITHELEEIIESVVKNQVPDLWISHSYLSSKTLMSWIKDLNLRLVFYNTWIADGYPVVYWFSGLFFPQSFLTSLLQNFARKYKIAIDSLDFTIEFIEDTPQKNPETGCYISGLFIEGARWDADTNSLQESLDQVLYSSLPIIWLKPIQKTDQTPRKNTIYKCPVYRTPKRAGVLNTTGHSTNYIMTLPLQILIDENHWIKRGVAILTQAND